MGIHFETGLHLVLPDIYTPVFPNDSIRVIAKNINRFFKFSLQKKIRRYIFFYVSNTPFACRMEAKMP